VHKLLVSDNNKRKIFYIPHQTQEVLHNEYATKQNKILQYLHSIFSSRRTGVLLLAVCRSNHDKFSICSFIKPGKQGCAALWTINSYLHFLVLFQLVPWLHMGRDSIVGIATRHGLDSPRIESWRGKSFCTHPDRPTQLPTQCVLGLSSVGLKQMGRGVDHPRPSSTMVQQRVEPYIYSFSGPSWPVPGWNLYLPLPQQHSFYPCEHQHSCLNKNCSHLDTTSCQEFFYPLNKHINLGHN